MYFFYIDETGTRDPKVEKIRPDGSKKALDHLYVLTAVGLYEWKWHAFDRKITHLKLELADHVNRTKHLRFDLADCEVKSTWLRLPDLRKKASPFLDALSEGDLQRITECYYECLNAFRMQIFSVVIDKRALHDYMDQHKLHKKAYELLMERIENYMREYHPKHQALMIMDDTDKTINRSLAMKHAYFQRTGNRSLDNFRHIVEYPFFTDSRLSNGVQLADLCGYNVYRGFRNLDFSYPFLQRILHCFYASEKTNQLKIDGLKVFPDNSELVGFADKSIREFLKKEPAQTAGSAPSALTSRRNGQ